MIASSTIELHLNRTRAGSPARWLSTSRSILGRFLEHSRAYEFTNGGDTETWIGSADLMHRNLDRRVEVLVKLDPGHARQISGLIDLGFADSTKAWIGQPDGTWELHDTDADGRPCVDMQEFLIAEQAARGRRAAAAAAGAA